MKEWRFVGLCLLLGGIIFFSLNQFAKALQPEVISLNGDLGGWEIEAILTRFDVVDTVDSANAWALDNQEAVPDKIYRYENSRWQLAHIFGIDEEVHGHGIRKRRLGMGVGLA